MVVESVDSKLNGHILTYLDKPLFYNDFWVPIIGYNELKHEDSMM